MAKTLVSALALASLPSALAFRNTSPFFLFSTADLSINTDHVAIAQSSKITRHVTETLKDCPSRTYFVVRQDGVSSADYLDSLSAPRLGQFVGGEHPDVKSTMAVSEVVESIEVDLISKHLQTKCGADVVQVDVVENKSPKISPRPEGAPPQVFEVNLPAPPATHRSAVLDQYDSLLEKLIADFADSRDYTVIYTTTAQTEQQAQNTQNQQTYEMEDPFGEAVHMELKRDTAAHKNRRAKAKTGALFERYQYFSPGLFMGISASIPLFLILLVGLRAISNLEVSYFAFSKEMGPSAQRKQ